jgi:sarcosine oxidase
MESYDAIVIGTGGTGSATLYHLARRGARALGLDRFAPGHDRGSSHGETRIIRLAYFEHPDYVPLLRRAYELWEELEGRSGVELHRQTGLLQIGPPEGAVVPGVLRSAREHGLEVEELEGREVERRFAGFRVPRGMTAVLERRAGYLRVEACVRAHVEAALALGAEWRSAAVERWSAGPSGIEVAARLPGDGGQEAVFSAKSLVVAPGPWAARLLDDLGVRFVVRRKAMFWYGAAEPFYRVERGSPAFLYETPAGVFYGFPRIDARGIKVAEHSGGRVLDLARQDPLDVDRALDREEERRVEDFLAACLPEAGRDCLSHSVCMYTMSPDEHFVLDRHPREPRVVFAAGLSGHGFKFTPVLGEVLAELALEGSTKAPVGFLRLGRPGLRERSDD